MNGATQYYSRVKSCVESCVESCEVKDLKHTLSDSRIVEFDNYSHKKIALRKDVVCESGQYYFASYDNSNILY